MSPIVAYRTLDEAIEYVNDRPRPLALYYFDYDSDRARSVLERTVSGGAAVNETVMHFAVESLPFGGVGPSGMGALPRPRGLRDLLPQEGGLLSSALERRRHDGPALRREGHQVAQDADGQ